MLRLQNILLDRRRQFSIDKQCGGGIVAESTGDTGNIHHSVASLLARIISVNMALVSGQASQLRMKRLRSRRCARLKTVCCIMPAHGIKIDDHCAALLTE